jgi:hypothetical protein
MAFEGHQNCCMDSEMVPLNLQSLFSLLPVAFFLRAYVKGWHKKLLLRRVDS